MIVDVQELKARMAYNGRLQREVADLIGISRTTFNAKLQSGDFKISEIHRLMKAIPLTMQDVVKIFFSN